MTTKMLQTDSKGRTTSGPIREEPNSTIVLIPAVEIPVKEKWLFENTSALQKIRTGLTQAKNKKLMDKGNFHQFADDEIE